MNEWGISHCGVDLLQWIMRMSLPPLKLVIKMLNSSQISCWLFIAGLNGLNGVKYLIWDILCQTDRNPWSKMAARSDAAAAPGPKDGAFMSFNVVCSSPNSVNLPLTHKEITPKHIYDSRSLLDIGNAYKQQLAPAAIEKLRGLCLLLEPDLETAASPTDATRTRQRRKRCERGRKRGKRGGIRARLRANPTRPGSSNTHALKRSLSGKQTGLNTTQSVYTAWGKGLLCVCFHWNMAKWQHPGLCHSVEQANMLPIGQRHNTFW